MSEAPLSTPGEGIVYFTLSMLMDSIQINALIGACGGPAGVWTQNLLEDLQTNYADSRELQRAINPMFDDIADRERNLFIKDFLLDTPNDPFGAQPSPPAGEESARDNHWRNVCADIELSLRDDVHWETEGAKAALTLNAPLEFSKVLCRTFWMVHSNDSLSYHLSLEVPYRRDLAGYYGLAMLLKAFYPTEGTDWVIGDGGWVATGAGPQPRSLLAFIEDLFERNAQDLFAKLCPKWLEKPVAKTMAARAWQRLILDDDDALASQPTRASVWKNSSRHRLLVLVRDKQVFRTIERARLEPNLLRELEPTKAQADRYHWQSLLGRFEAQAKVLQDSAKKGSAAEAVTRDDLLATVFLSGFFQNIVDFLEQDGLEVHDGISPLYPPDGAGSSNEGYFIYATPKIVFEVVSTSRSLDRAGRKWLGTCPYLFLVHITIFHNESIVRAYEARVSRLVRRLEDMGLKSAVFARGRGNDMLLTEAFEVIRQFRLETFEHVHKHLSFNMFRYKTEQAFFKSIEEIRGISARQLYWDGVLQHLTETVDALKEDRTSRYGLRISWLGFVLALVGFLQLWFAVFPVVEYDKGPFHLHWALSIAFGALLTGALVRLFFQYTRKWFKRD